MDARDADLKRTALSERAMGSPEKPSGFETFKCANCLQDFRVFQSELVSVGGELKRLCLTCASRIGPGKPLGPFLEKKRIFICSVCKVEYQSESNAPLVRVVEGNMVRICQFCRPDQNTAPAGQKNAASPPSEAATGVCSAAPPPNAPPAPAERPDRPETPKTATEILEDRVRFYGDPSFGHESIGIAFTAIIQNHYRIALPHPIPGHIAALMMASQKVIRAAAPYKFQEDNYTDGHNYLEIAKECDPRSKL